jgi:hypothetical protein
MKRTLKIAAATIALLLTVVIVENIVRDNVHASTPAWTLTYELNLDAPAPSTASTGSLQADATRYRVTTTAKTATDLGQHRDGCALTRALPPEATCDIAVAFPDIGLNGTVVVVGSDRNSSKDALTFKLDN